MKRNLFLAIAMLIAFLSEAVSIAGFWNGKLSLGLQNLTIVFNIDRDSCTMYSPDQTSVGIPAVLKLCTTDSLIVEVPQLNVVFEGKINDKKIDGVFTQMGHKFNLTLNQGKPVYNRPQSPKPPFQYKTEEVSFTNPKDGAVLSGTLSYPADFKKGKTPVVLLVTGSGQQNRDEEIFEHRPFAVIAHHLAMNGIASLRYDDRGKDKSTGELKNATTATFAEDAEFGLCFLRNLKKFGKIGLLGHSEGGSIAFKLAGEEKTDFIISLAGTALNGTDILIEQNRLSLPYKGISTKMTEDYCRALRKVYQYKIAYGKTSSINTQMLVTMAISESKAEISESLRNNLILLMETDNAWLNHFIAYNPIEDIRKIKCPIMAINGEKDNQVISKTNLAIIKDNLQWKEGDIIKEYEGLNHLFQHCNTGAIEEYIKISETISPEVLDDITIFIKKL